MIQSKCLFCQIIKDEIPSYRVYEDEDFLAFLDINPVNLGHTLLTPKDHYRNLFDLPQTLTAKLGPSLQKLAHAIKEGTDADGVNVVWNNEAAAGQLIFHAHVHLIPRFESDGFKHWQGRGGEAKADFERIQTSIKDSFI